MARRTHRLTLIVVPQTTKRSFTVTFSPAWLGLGVGALVVLIAALAGALWHYQDEAVRLRQEVVEMEELRQKARLQQAEIEAMQETARTVETQLQEIRQLEQDIKSLTGTESDMPSRSGSGRGDETNSTARGGPDSGSGPADNGLTLASVLPGDVRPYILARRDTLALDLKLGRTAGDLDRTVTAARRTAAELTGQVGDLERAKLSLAEGREQVAARLDYLAHRPSGWPVLGARITDPFGTRWSPFGQGRQHHDGLDLAQDYWEPVYATAQGTVVHAGWKDGGYGYCVIIDHGYGYTTLYAHLADWDVEEGQSVSRGDVIGWVGDTGLSTGPHLHYEVHIDGEAVDPVPYLE